MKRILMMLLAALMLCPAAGAEEIDLVSPTTGLPVDHV